MPLHRISTRASPDLRIVRLLAKRNTGGRHHRDQISNLLLCMLKLAEEAVINELVSTRLFPVIRENTGKFAIFGFETAKTPRISD